MLNLVFSLQKIFSRTLKHYGFLIDTNDFDDILIYENMKKEQAVSFHSNQYLNIIIEPNRPLL